MSLRPEILLLLILALSPCSIATYCLFDTTADSTGYDAEIFIFFVLVDIDSQQRTATFLIYVTAYMREDRVEGINATYIDIMYPTGKTLHLILPKIGSSFPRNGEVVSNFVGQTNDSCPMTNVRCQWFPFDSSDIYLEIIALQHAGTYAVTNDSVFKIAGQKWDILERDWKVGERGELPTRYLSGYDGRSHPTIDIVLEKRAKIDLTTIFPFIIALFIGISYLLNKKTRFGILTVMLSSLYFYFSIYSSAKPPCAELTLPDVLFIGLLVSVVLSVIATLLFPVAGHAFVRRRHMRVMSAIAGPSTVPLFYGWQLSSAPLEAKYFILGVFVMPFLFIVVECLNSRLERARLDTKFGADQRELILRGEELLREVERSGLYWDWNSSLRGETRDILEGKVPLLAVYRNIYERWSQWSSDSQELILKVAGLGSDSNQDFGKAAAATRKLLETHHSLVKCICDGIMAQLQVLRTPVDLLARERPDEY